MALMLGASCWSPVGLRAAVVWLSPIIFRLAWLAAVARSSAVATPFAKSDRAPDTSPVMRFRAARWSSRLF
jgi:hypothetical protein